MKKRVPDKFWFPWWPDKWIFGSIRIECTLEERAIWVDLLSLASKDNGHIRANEEMPYPVEQLAGMLRVPKETLSKAIEKFINLKDKNGKGKLTKTKEGTLYVTKWEKYQFSESYLRVQKYREKESDSRHGNAKSLQCNKKTLPYNNTLNNNKINNNKEKAESLHEKLFKDFWEAYPKKVAKDYAKEKFMILMRKGVSKELIKGFNGYIDYLKMRKTKDNFNQEVLNPATFLMKNRWKDYIDFKYKPRL